MNGIEHLKGKTMDSKALLETLLPEVGSHRAGLVKKYCKAEEDLIAMATIYAMQAHAIWKELGDEKMAAAQFYAWADRCATASSK